MKRAHLTFGAAVAAVALTASACSSDPASGDESGQDSSRQEAVEEAAQETRAACPASDPEASKADADRTAILSYGDAPATSLDPIRRVEGSESTVLRTIYDALVELDAEGKPSPGLATSWEMVDDDTMEFQLREDVLFQDGTPFNAEAVKFNIERAQNEPSSTIANLLENVQEVEVVDDHTVRMHLSPANPGALPITLSERAGMMVSPTAVKEAGSAEAFNENPVGAGPYKVDGEWFPVESINVRAWDGYWDEDNRFLGGIDFKRLSFDASVDGLKSGDLDLQIVEPGDVDTLCAEDDLRVTVSPTDELRMFVINHTWEPFDDLRVRQALAHGLDREIIAEVMTNGIADGAYQWFREGQLPYDEELNDLYPYDPEKAQELLAEAGYDGDLSFKSEIGTGSTSYQRMGEIIQAEYQKIGVEMDLQLVDRNDMMGRIYGLGGAEIVVGSSPLAVSSVTQPSERFKQYLYEDGTLNPSGVEIDGIRELVEEADATVDEARRAELFQEAHRMILEELQGGIPLYFVPGVTAYGDHVGGVERGATRADLDFKGVYITKDKTPVGERDN